MFLSSIHLTWGQSQNLTVFTISKGLYKRKLLQKGPEAAPEACQFLMELLFTGPFHDFALVYLDDIFVFGKTIEKHLQGSEKVHAWLDKSGLKIYALKSKIFQNKNLFSKAGGSEKEVEVDPENVATKEKTKTLCNFRKLRAVVCLVGFYRNNLPVFAKNSEPLYQLLKEKKRILWTKDWEGAVQ